MPDAGEKGAMGQPANHSPVLLVMAVFSRHDDALDWGIKMAESSWGPIVLHSETFPFDQTPYYESTMGGELKKTLVAFERLIDPALLPGLKRQSNDWEQQAVQSAAWDDLRPVNLDPGYITEAKLVLATTKDRDHRIYLGEGIFAEVTLFFRGGQWRPREWTYPDYRQESYHAFFLRCRDELRKRL